MEGKVYGCHTKESAETFLRILSEKGYLWRSGSRLIDDLRWTQHEIYYRIDGAYVTFAYDRFYYENHGLSIIIVPKAQQEILRFMVDFSDAPTAYYCNTHQDAVALFKMLSLKGAKWSTGERLAEGTIPKEAKTFYCINNKVTWGWGNKNYDKNYRTIEYPGRITIKKLLEEENEYKRKKK